MATTAAIEEGASRDARIAEINILGRTTLYRHSMGPETFSIEEASSGWVSALMRMGKRVDPEGAELTQDTPTIIGRIPEKSGKTPKTSAEGRVCAERGCDTKLTKYNNADYCYGHKPRRFPRVRGRIR